MAEFLPGTTGQRLAELRESRGLTREALANRAGVSTSTLSRLESGQTQKFSDELLTAMAQEFGVSTDFLLGLTNIPDRKNYDISELGLSAQAARNLYTRKVNTDIVNRLLEHPRFATLTAMVAQYLDDSIAANFAVQNQVFSSLAQLLYGIEQTEPEQKMAATETARTVNLSKTPPYQMELTKIQNTFMTMLKEMKRDAGSNLEVAKALTKEVMEKMLTELTKGQDTPLISITPEQIVDAIIHTVGSVTPDSDKLSELRLGLLALFKALPRAAHGAEQ